jgi:hypothetical protein
VSLGLIHLPGVVNMRAGAGGRGGPQRDDPSGLPRSPLTDLASGPFRQRPVSVTAKGTPETRTVTFRMAGCRP